jgi:hypothetical protein
MVPQAASLLPVPLNREKMKLSATQGVSLIAQAMLE